MPIPLSVGRSQSVLLLLFYMYDQAFNIGLWRQGFAAAIGMVGAVVMVFFVAILLYIFRPRGG